MRRTRQRCAWCAGLTDKAEGIYLGRLYPGELMCRGCGRRSLFCSCERAR